MMSDRARRLWKIGATTAFGWFVFFLVFVLTLPYGRLKDYLVVLAEQQGYNVEVKSAGPALGLGIRLKDMTISSRPSGGGKPTRIVVPVAKVRWSLLGALARRPIKPSPSSSPTSIPPCTVWRLSICPVSLGSKLPSICPCPARWNCGSMKRCPACAPPRR